VANPQTNVALAQLRKLLAAERDTKLADAHLLERFLANREEAAFAALVKRHGSMVLGVCQSVLRHSQDAEDACQATFLVLANKAGSIRKKSSVASWLHGVAHRLARKLQASRKPAPEGQPSQRAPANPMDELSWREVRQVVHEELERLPDKYRQPLILCYLEGNTQEEAARQLGWTAGTLKGMLTRGRDLLRSRLTRRGLGLAAPLFAGALAPRTAGAVLAIRTARAAVSLVSGKALGAGISAQAVAMAKGGINAMMMTKLKVGAAVVLAMGMLAAGAGLATYQAAEGDQAVVKQKDEPKTAQVLQKKQPKPKEQNKPRLDLHGDPLPDGAVARIGTTRFLQGSGGYIFPIAYTPDGKHLLSVDSGNAVVFWGAATGKEMRRIENRGNFIYTFVLSPDGKTLATVGEKYPNILLWDVATGKEVHQITHETLSTPKVVEHPASAVFTPDGKTFAVSKGDGIIRVWDTVTWQEKQPLPKGGSTLQLPNVGASVYHFLSDGKTLISGWNGSKYNGITWLDSGTGKEIRRLDVQPASSYGWTMTASPDGKRLAAVVNPGVLYIWNAATGEEISRTDLGAQDVAPCCLCFSPDSQTLACNASVGNAGGRAASRVTMLFAGNTGKVTHRWSNVGEVRYMAFSPDGKTLAQSRQTVIDFRDAVTGKPAMEIQRLSESVNLVAFGGDGKSLIAGCRDGRVSSWESLTGKPQPALQAAHDEIMPQRLGLFTASFTPDGTKAAGGDAKGALHVWEPMTGKTLCQIEGVLTKGVSPVFSRDGTMLALHDKDGISVWDTATGKLRQTLPAKFIHNHVFSNDGRLLATATQAFNGVAIESTIRLWDVATGKIKKELTWNDGDYVQHLAFSADGKHLISYHVNYGSAKKGTPENASLRLWDLGTGRELSRFTTPAVARVWGDRSIVLSPDFKTVAMVTLRGMILCEMATGHERGRFSGHRAEVFSLAFSPDGRLLASGSGDYTGLVWDVTGVCPDGKWTARDVPPAEIKRLWTDLADADGAKAYHAMWTLVAAGGQAVPFLAERLRLVPGADDQRVARLITDLDSEQFKVRTLASKELQQLGELAEPALRKALNGTPTPETRQRLTLLLDELRNRPLRSEQLQVLRALEVLENLATPDARQLLQALAKGAPGTMQTKEAKASLDRLGKRVLP